MSETRRERYFVPQRRDDGRWRCETGSALGGKHWCANPAAWVIEGCTTACPGAIVCDECMRFDTGAVRNRALYVPLDNPIPPPPDCSGEPHDAALAPHVCHETGRE